jgi:anti-anti-sigma regulatory factor
MATCTFEREVERDHAVIRMSGTFDGPSAAELRERLAREPASGALVLDFSQVREFADLGVAVLANVLALAPADRRLLLRGLRQHQLRIFRYCGVRFEALRAAGDDEDGRDARSRA